MEESADQLILEYLAVVADVAHRHLGSRERVDFMGRLRNRIEEHRGGSTDPAKVRKVLARFGDPERLVLRERRRLDAARAAAAPAAEGPAAAEGLPAGRPAGSRPEPEPAAADPAGAADLGTLARRRPLEVGALGLLGLGGLLLPVPLWLFGAGLAGYSRMWTMRAKLIGLAGPLVVTGLGVLWYAVSGGEGVGIVDAIRTAGPAILRVAGLAGAIFLGVLLLRGAGVRSLRVRRTWSEP